MPMRSTAVLFLFICISFAGTALAQNNELVIQGQTGKFYLQHTVLAKENWYSIGRLYNISPKVIAPFNNTALTSPLAIGQTLQIPLTAANFSQDNVKDGTETLVPIYHIVQDKEWMYRLSVNYKTNMAALEKWNHIGKDQVHAGMHMIVGFLKVKTALSALATTMPEGSQDIKAPASVGTQKDGQTAPASAAPATASSSTATVATGKPTKVPAAESTATKVPAAAVSAASPSHAVQNASPDESNTPVAPASMPAAKAAINFNGGFFKTEFTNGGKSAEGQAGIFKSTSGWQDGKYYALMNNLPVGTIVRITSVTTRRSIYAKILGQLPDMKESAVLTARISNAAASELGEADGKFNVEISY